MRTDLSKDGVFTIQPSGFSECEKKLGAIGLFSRASHSNQSSMHKTQARVWLRVERRTISTFATIATSGGISSLTANFPYYAMENAVIVVAFHAELHEISTGHRRLLRPQLDIDITNGRFQHYLARSCRLQNSGHFRLLNLKRGARIGFCRRLR